MLIWGLASQAFWLVYKRNGEYVDCSVGLPSVFAGLQYFRVGLPSVLAGFENGRDVDFGVGFPSVLAALQIW